MPEFKSTKPKPTWAKPASEMHLITEALGRTPNESMAERRTVTTRNSNTIGDRIQADYVYEKQTGRKRGQ